MTQQFESWADSMGLDELDSDYNWAKQAWEAAQAAQPVGINGLTEAETSASMSVMGLSKPKATQPAQMPEGWKLVPVEPTEAMLKAADDGDDEYTLRNFGPNSMRVMQGPYDHWCAMLAAAPSTKEPGK